MENIRHFVKKLHNRLLPEEAQEGALPYVWLIYLFIFIAPLFVANFAFQYQLSIILAAALFVVLYFNTFWQEDSIQVARNILLILTLGLLTSWYNAGGSVFYVYAAAFCCQLKTKKLAFSGVFLVVTIAAIYNYLFALPIFFYIPAVAFSLIVGGINIYEYELRNKNKLLKLSQEELQQTAATVERERIARDLHDLIGHTFSLITVKAQLANKLIDKDIDKAKIELSDLEKLSRHAMAEVRETVTGYSLRDMDSEIAKAKLILNAAEVTPNFQLEEAPKESNINSTLAFIIRESVTNLVKHSQARSCELNFSVTPHCYKLTIKDDGNGITHPIHEGNGLTNMRQRIESIGGTISFSVTLGFQTQIEVPRHG